MTRRPRSHRVALAVALILVAAACGDEPTNGEPTTPPPPTTSPPPAEATAVEAAITDLIAAGRIDLTPSGNRVIEGPGNLLGSEPIRVGLPGTAAAEWIVPNGQAGWTVVLDDGTVVAVALDGATTDIVSTAQFDSADGPPLVVNATVTSADTIRALFADPLVDTRVTTDGTRLVALAGPTDRYGHAVLGDAIEASALEVIEADGTRRTAVTIPAPDVFEAVSPMLADVDGDDDLDAVVTAANSDGGARLVAYDLTTGEVVAESEPIGLGNRWRNLLAVAPVGPAGELEAIDIRTPHIGGTLQFFRLVEGRFELAASADTYSTHRIGSRNLDLGIVTDADGNGSLDVLLPTQSMLELAVVTRDDSAAGGTREVGRVDLGGSISTNIAASISGDGVAYAVGLSDGSLRVWPS